MASLNAYIQDFGLELVVVQDFGLVLSFPTTTSFNDLGSKPKIVNPMVQSITVQLIPFAVTALSLGVLQLIITADLWLTLPLVD